MTAALVFVTAFCPRKVIPRLATPSSLCNTGSSSLQYGSNDEDENEKTSFDMDFADAMSKPLPEWFLQEKKEKEEMMKDIYANRDRIAQEFKAKYEISEEEKERQRREKEAKLQARRMALKRKKGKEGLFSKALGVSTADTEDVLEDDSTKEKWEKFWEEEEETTGFSLPGFFEVFPELKLMWPTWAKRRGQAIECEVDADCDFPQACCPHPIIPGDKFCCTGWTQRIMVPAYQRQFIQSNGPLQGDNNNNGDNGGMDPPETGGYGLPEN